MAKRGGRDRIATAAEGLALAAELSLQAPTPVDSASPSGDLTGRRRRPSSPVFDVRRHHGRHAHPDLVDRVPRHRRSCWRPASPIRRTARPRPAATPAAATPTPIPTPAGPTPTPSFVRPTPTPQPTFFVYTVVPGDSLDKIAKRFGTTGRSIAYWNRATYPSLDPESGAYRPNDIKVGWTLVLIPHKEVDPENLPTLPPSAAPSTGGSPSEAPAGD